MGGLDGCGASVEQHEAAGAVGVLGLQRLAPLPQHCRLLIPQTPCTMHAHLLTIDLQSGSWHLLSVEGAIEIAKEAPTTDGTATAAVLRHNRHA